MRKKRIHFLWLHLSVFGLYETCPSGFPNIAFTIWNANQNQTKIIRTTAAICIFDDAMITNAMGINAKYPIERSRRFIFLLHRRIAYFEIKEALVELVIFFIAQDIIEIFTVLHLIQDRILVAIS